MKDINKKRQIIIYGIIIFVFVVVFSVSYSFIDISLQGNKKQVITAGTIKLVLNEGEELKIENALPVYDEVGMLEKGFSFTVSNEGIETVGYKVYLEKLNQDNELATDIVRYSIEKDGQLFLGPDSVSSMETNNYLIDQDNIRKNITYAYTIRLWIDSDVIDQTKISNKSLKFRVKIESAEPASEDVILSATLDGQSIEKFPVAADNYGIESVDCTNDAIGTFRTGDWSVVVENFATTGTTCTTNFSSSITTEESDTLAVTTREELEEQLASAKEEKQQIVDAMKNAGMTVSVSDSENPTASEIITSINSYAQFQKETTVMLWSLSGGVNSETADLTGAFTGSWTLGSEYTQNGVRTATGITEKAIDVTNIKKITFDLGFRTTGDRTAYATVGLYDGSNWVSGKYQQKSYTSSGNASGTQQVVIDVSSLTGTYYLRCLLQDHTYCYARVNSVYISY